jgi:sorbose reductase
MGDASLSAATAAPPLDARQALTTRTIPTMTLSSSSNPLTAPLPPLPASLSAVERALARFAVTGNAVITGGAGTLALASARALLEHGLGGLALLDLPSTLASSAAAIEELKRDFPNAHTFTVPIDVTDEAQVALAMSRAVEGFAGHGIDILCCFAGVVGCVPSLNASGSEWRRVIDVNQTGAFLCAQAAAQHMIGKGTEAANTATATATATRSGSSILFISSISGHTVNYPQPQAAYNVSKAGVRHLTRCLAAEWAVHGIRVNCISPGYMDTVLNAGESLRTVRDVWASRCPMGRMGDVEELTGTVVMLCGKRSGRYITGADIVVDGGAVCF